MIDMYINLLRQLRRYSYAYYKEISRFAYLIVKLQILLQQSHEKALTWILIKYNVIHTRITILPTKETNISPSL